MNCIQCSNPLERAMRRCQVCGKWNPAKTEESKGIPLNEIIQEETERYETGPWDPNWGGGIAVTSVTLLGGAPGAGKSTMVLQIANQIEGKVAYISAEEEATQLKERADRLRIEGKNIRVVDARGGELNIEETYDAIEPSLVIIDSLPGIFGATGLRKNNELAIEFLSTLKLYAGMTYCPAIVIQHITKKQDFAGFMQLQHHVDTTIIFKVIKGVRVLCTEKNRFGQSPIETRFMMTARGLKIKTVKITTVKGRRK